MLTFPTYITVTQNRISLWQQVTYKNV